ncbi:MAG: hypothetical protein HKN73_02000 [Gemmatimonadetes bacterium]|nr:hypothetical protein [Gemmatimonadota bacterium]
MLAAMGSGTAEAAAGELADANEHYEDARSLVHAHTGSGGGSAQVIEADQDSDDQHIKGYDHCGHTHGSSVRAASLPNANVSIIPIPPFVDITACPPDAPATGLYHPPKA